MKKRFITLSIVMITQSQLSLAKEKYQHFASLNSNDIPTALCNIQTYNETLTSITSKANLTAEDMVKIHELTYTLENAVNFLTVTLNNVAVNLEDVHQASEQLDQNTIKQSAEQYLMAISLLLSQKRC